MAVFRQFKYTTNTTEIEFMQGLIDLICGLGPNITCEDTEGNPTTAALQFADLTSASKATFVFNFGNDNKLTMVRGDNNSAGTKNYYINGSQLQFGWANTTPTQVSNDRAYSLAYIQGTDICGIWFGNYNASGMSSMYRSYARLIVNSDIYTGTTNGHNILNASFTGENSSVNYVGSLPYSSGAGQIDYFDHVVFVSNGIKAFDFYGLYACSTVTQYSSIALPNGRNYFAISTNAMVDVTPEPEEEEQEATTEGQWDSVPSMQ